MIVPVLPVSVPLGVGPPAVIVVFLPNQCTGAIKLRAFGVDGDKVLSRGVVDRPDCESGGVTIDHDVRRREEFASGLGSHHFHSSPVEYHGDVGLGVFCLKRLSVLVECNACLYITYSDLGIRTVRPHAKSMLVSPVNLLRARISRVQEREHARNAEDRASGRTQEHSRSLACVIPHIVHSNPCAQPEIEALVMVWNSANAGYTESSQVKDTMGLYKLLRVVGCHRRIQLGQSRQTVPCG